MKTLLKAFYSLRLNMIRAQQHDLQIAWAYTKRIENNALALVYYRQAVYQRQNQLNAKREHFEAKLIQLKSPVFKFKKA